MTRQHCRGCRAPIRWAHTCDGSTVALDPHPHGTGRYAYVATDRGWRVRTFPPGTLSGLAAAERWREHAETCAALRAAGSAR